MSDVTLAQFGWRAFFSKQVSAEEKICCRPVRVMSVHRGRVTVAGEGFEDSIVSTLPGAEGGEDRPTVGDWLLIDHDNHGLKRILDRASLFKRPAPGDDRRVQLIAANIDTLFVVTSCNRDFNVARLERYLVLAREVGVRPVVVLTKADQTPVPGRFADAARALQSDLRVESVNARDPTSAALMARYCAAGQTVALVGSSGVGKSTLINTLTGSADIATQAVREDDGKGRHTTTVREMHRLSRGGWLIDTPGIRELQMSAVTSGVAEVFDDVTDVALECQFTNCGHGEEPGCAIVAAVALGSLDPARIDRWRKLAEEDAQNSGAVETRPRSRSRRTGNRKSRLPDQ
ncbi:ribosome small subunit-dependent GTPase A [Sphingomonas japonica]|uniref:Small ribosomal subunit biogenesis GTPase RsgA n=1 Tax=Sphingomonas japonica TaxID=511662 RepID=A0ABX0U7A9_9SPHN|nr:ribosome small subunit-dependent GTPase A [Sphingomonas japonica]NIJ25222.1 ribosome biogenesis GTPase [Sphingomonas japonica]